MSSEAIRDAVVYASIPEMFQSRMEQYADRVLLLRRHAGTWQTWRGRDMQDAVRRWVSALLALGVNKGDHIAVVSATRMEWAIADLAILHAGAVTVGIYPQLPDDDIAYQLAHSDARMVFVENGAMLDRIRRMRARCPRLERAILFEGEANGDLFVVPRRALDADGDAEAFRRAWRAIGKDDLATIVYTSGTTGRPRGARLTHENLCFVVASASSVVPSHGEQDFGVVFLPLTHVLQRVGIYLGIYNGARGAYAESLETLIDTFRELRPTVQVSVPRIWEKMHARIRALIQAAPAHRRFVFHWALGVGRATAPYRARRAALPATLAARWWLARAFWRRLVWPRVGFGRVRFLSSGGAPIGMELLEFFYAMDMLILEAWGLTETAAPATLNRPDAFKFGTVGRPLPGVDVRVALDGELLVRGRGVFRGYHKDAEATAAAFDGEGYFKTGDIGTVDADGFVTITDRKKDLIVTAGGKKIAPQNLERLFKGHSMLGPCLIHGDRRPFVSAIFTLDPEEIGPWAKARGLPDDPGKLAVEPAVQALVGAAVAAVNARLAEYEQVRRWAVVGDAWTDRTSELTPTLKVRRRILEQRYRALLDGFYEAVR
jgi:long-chain acyl-CoA synthetase